MKLILASSSPYRRALLERLQIPFSVAIPDIDETARPGELPEALARRLAREKARAIAEEASSDIVIGSDQVATLDGRAPIGKPGTLDRARQQLLAASGRTMYFYTAFCVLSPDSAPIEHCVPIAVAFRELTVIQIDRYLALEQPLDCAGAARCEGLGITLLDAIRTDDPTALIGLPLILLSRELEKLGMTALSPIR